MILITAVIDTLLYICFAIVVGALLLQAIPNGYKPEIKMSKKRMSFLAFLIGILSFGPLLQLFVFFYGKRDFLTLVHTLIFTTDSGRVWLITLLISIVLSLFMYFAPLDRVNSIIGLGVTFFLIILVSLSGHIASHSKTIGLLSQTLHFSLMAVWFGVLIVISFFSINKENWKAFRSWFTPSSIIAIVIIAVSGLVMMKYTVPEYQNSWLLPYGEALLLKHLLYFVIILFGCMNGFLLKKDMKLGWLRAEVIVIVIVLIITGFMTNSSPPYIVAETIEHGGISSLFEMLSQTIWVPEMSVALQGSLNSISLFVLAFILLIVQLITFITGRNPYLFLFLSLMLVLVLFLALLLSITPSL